MLCKKRVVQFRELMPQQLKFQEYAKPLQHLACFMEMRLGKTLAVIRWVKGLETEQVSSYPCLVVAPVSVIEAWEKELTLEMEKYIVIHGKTFDKRTDLVVNEAFAQEGRIWVLINYESLRATPGLAFLPWWVVALDESNYVKNPNAKISKLCIKGFRDTEHRVIMSGLPSPEGEIDLYSQFQFLHGSFMDCNNYWSYRSKCFQLRYDGWQLKPEFSEPIKNLVHSKAFVLTRKQAGIGSRKIKETRVVTMSADQTKVYNKIEDEFVAEVGVESLETDHVIVQRTWLARVAGGCDADGNLKWLAKVNELVYLLQNDLANQPVVVWFRFDAEIKNVAQVLRNKGILFNTLTGDDTREDRKRKQDWFRTCHTPTRVMLTQIKKVAEYGVDMSVSSTAIYYSVTQSTMEMTQTEERILHPKKSEPLLYIYLVTKDTVDEDAVTAVRAKTTNAKLFMRKFKFSFIERRKRLGKQV